MTEALEAADREKVLRDLLWPGIAAAAFALGLRNDILDLVWEDGTLKLMIADEGRELVRPIASMAEAESGAYREQFVPRVNAAFDDFLRAGGVTGAGAYLDKRGPRQAPGAEEEVLL